MHRRSKPSSAVFAGLGAHSGMTVTSMVWMAAQVKANGAGDKLGKDNPSGAFVRKFSRRVGEMGTGWHLGKESQDVGRPNDVAEAKVKPLATPAMRMRKMDELLLI